MLLQWLPATYLGNIHPRYLHAWLLEKSVSLDESIDGYISNTSSFGGKWAAPESAEPRAQHPAVIAGGGEPGLRLNQETAAVKRHRAKVGTWKQHLQEVRSLKAAFRRHQPHHRGRRCKWGNESSEWRALAISNRWFSNVLLCRKSAFERNSEKLLSILLESNAPFSELPSESIHSVRHKYVKHSAADGTIKTKEYISFTD